MLNRIKKRLNFRAIAVFFAVMILLPYCMTIPVSAVGLWEGETAAPEYEAEAEEELPLLVDDAWLLMPYDKDEISEILESVSDKWNADVVIVTTSSTDGKTAEAYADDFYDYNGYGRDSRNTGILFLVDMGERQWAFSTTGKAIDVFGDRDLEVMEDEIIGYLSSGDYKTAFETFAEYVDYYFQAYEAYLQGDSSLYEESYAGHGFHLGVGGKIFIGLAVGAVVGFAVAGSMKSKMVGIRRSRYAGNYVMRDSMQMSRAADIFLYRNVTRVKIQTESTGSGTHHSGSVHVGSSGVSHGGRSGRF